MVVWSLSLHEDAPVLSDNSVQQLFVEYKFLTCDAAELETPFSLPKKSAGYTMSYNFQKGTSTARIGHLDEQTDRDK